MTINVFQHDDMSTGNYLQIFRRTTNCVSR